MTVRWSLLCGRDAEDAGRPGAIVHHDRPAVLGADPLGDEPRNAVVGTAGRIGNDDANRLCRVWLSCASTQQRRRRGKERGSKEEFGCRTAGQTEGRAPKRLSI